MPPLDESNLWPAQKRAIVRLEQSLADNRPGALIQMATGSGKTFTACNFIYRLIKFAGACRILFQGFCNKVHHSYEAWLPRSGVSLSP